MNVAVLGGGVTGLTAAWLLSEAGHAVRVLEAGDRLGGSICTEETSGWLVECGANSLREDTAEIRSLLARLGLEPERIESSPAAANRYVALDGRLVPVPSGASPQEFMATPLLGAAAKLRVAAETGFRPQIRTQDVSVADFAREHFGEEVLRRLVQPMVGGIWAGDPECLSTRHAFPQAWAAERTSGSVLRGLAKARSVGAHAKVISFPRGLRAIPDALASRLPPGTVILGARAKSIQAARPAGWRVRWVGPQGEAEGDFDTVVAALPAQALAALEIGQPGARPLLGLEAIDHPPVASVFLGFRRDQVSHPLDGFGALVPSSEGRSILGVVFSSSVFPGRAPEGHVALTALAGGALNPALAALPAAELTARVLEDLRVLLGTRGEPVFTRHFAWPRAIPQYALGFERHLGALAACERDFPGILIGGSVRDGISIPECLRSGVSLAKRVS